MADRTAATTSGVGGAIENASDTNGPVQPKSKAIAKAKTTEEPAMAFKSATPKLKSITAQVGPRREKCNETLSDDCVDKTNVAGRANNQNPNRVQTRVGEQPEPNHAQTRAT